MLNEVFRSDPPTFFDTSTYHGTYDWNITYPYAILPWVEELDRASGMVVHTIPTVMAPTSIFLLMWLKTRYWPSWAVVLMQFDSITGEQLHRVAIASSLGTVLIGGMLRTRLGKLFFKHSYGTTLFDFILTIKAKFPDPDYVELTYGVTTYDSSHFAGMAGFGQVGIDETRDVLLNSLNSRSLDVYKLSTGALRYSMTMPDIILQVALEDAHRAYVLCANRIVVLVDYTRGDIMGAVKIPPPPTTPLPNSTQIAWDSIFRRLLVFDKVPDSPSGACLSRILGYRFVPVPIRLTTPVPLIAPRAGRTVPVMVQVIGDMNEGVGGYIIDSQVTGDGVLVGFPITDNEGRGLSQVWCPALGSATITCTATLPVDPTVTSGGGNSMSSVQRVSLQVAGASFDWRGVSAFGLFVKWLNNDTAAIDALCTDATSRGYTLLRVIGVLSGTPWTAAGYDLWPGCPLVTVPNYYIELKAFVQYVNAKGLAVEFVCFGDFTTTSVTTQAERLTHVQAVTTALLGIDKVFIEILNEPLVNGGTLADLTELAQAIAAIDANRHLALGATNQDSVAYGVLPADYLTFHGLRSTTWSWLTQYWGCAAISQQTWFPVEDEPNRPEFDGEVGKYFALGCLARFYQIGLTYHYGDGRFGDVTTGLSATCAQAMADGLNAPSWNFGGDLFKDYTGVSPLQDVVGGPEQIVGRATATSTQFIAMNVPSGWTPLWKNGWQQTAITKKGTGDCAQYITGSFAGSVGDSNPTAPNMMATMNTILNNGTAWDLDNGNAFDQVNPLGRGGFTEAAVAAMHAIDARFGHIDKNPGQNQYNGHAVDAIMFKRDDGSGISEIYDIITGSGHLQWAFSSATTANTVKWKWPP